MTPRTPSTQGSTAQPGPDPDKLPLRWAVILMIGGVLGTVVGLFSGLGYGVATTIATIGLLHTILGR